MSDAELEDILRFGFRPGVGTMETKLFTTSTEDAAFFAQNILISVGPEASDDRCGRDPRQPGVATFPLYYRW